MMKPPEVVLTCVLFSMRRFGNMGFTLIRWVAEVSSRIRGNEMVLCEKCAAGDGPLALSL